MLGLGDGLRPALVRSQQVIVRAGMWYGTMVSHDTLKVSLYDVSMVPNDGVRG